jgi:hypothetical protein
MFIDTNDKTIVFHPDALRVIRDWLIQIETTVGQGAYAPEEARKQSESRIRALAQILNSGFGPASRVTPDTPSGSLFVAEYPTRDGGQPYVFGCVQHADGQIGVHS